MYKKKYKKGREIISFEGLRKHLEKSRFVYLRDKIQHEGWVLSLQFRVLIGLLDKGLIKTAIKVPLDSCSGEVFVERQTNGFAENVKHAKECK